MSQTAKAEPQLIISWQVANYTPDWYQGRRLPTPGNIVTATVDLVDKNGRLVDLSKTQIYWYVNHAFVGGGLGLQDINTVVPDSVGGDMSIGARLPNYQDMVILKTVSLPVIRPKAVIDVAFPNGLIPSKTGILMAWPFFFSTTDPDSLVYTWKINDQEVKNSENPEFLKLSSRGDSPIQVDVELSIRNSIRLESANNAYAEVVVGG